MRKFLLRSLALLLVIGYSLTSFAADSPVADDGKWYYVKSQRGDNGPWWTYNAGENRIKADAFTGDDIQKFTLVSTANGRVTIKNFAGNKLTGNDDNGYFSETGTEEGWTLTSQIVNGVQGWSFPGERNGLHQYNGDTGRYWQIASGYYNLTDNCTFFFYEESRVEIELVAETLRPVLASSKTLHVNAKEGEDPGTYPASAIADLGAAIDAAEAALNDSEVTAAQLEVALADLTAVISAFNEAIILPKISSEGNEYWYYIQGTRPMNTYITDSPSNNTLPNSPVIPDDTQLWKFVENTNGTANGFALVNKATSEYIGTDLGNNTKLISVVDMPANNLQFIVSDIFTDGVARFWIENAPSSTPDLRFHAGGEGHQFSLMNWTGNKYEESSWLILDYGKALKVFLKESIDKAQDILNSSVVGDDFGQFNSDAKDALLAALQDAQAVNDDEDALSEDILAARAAVDEKYNAYVASQIMDLNVLLSEEEGKYRWYKMVNQMYTGEVISSDGRAIGGELIIKADDSDNALWRFEHNGDGTVKFINKSTGLSIEDKGTSTAALLIDPVSGTDLKFYPTGGAITAGRVNAGVYQYFHSAGHRDLVGWEINSGASRWQLEFAGETAIPTDAYTVTVLNANEDLGTAVITGAEDTSADFTERASVTAAPNPGSVFVNWTDASDNEVSTLPTYAFDVAENVTLTANFEKLGDAVAPLAPLDGYPVYYYVQSASDGSHVFDGYSGDFRSHVMITPDTNSEVIHNRIDAASSENHMLWQIVEENKVIYLKNKKDGRYFTGSNSVNTSGNAFIYSEIEESGQYAIRTSDQESFANTWKNNKVSRLGPASAHVKVNGQTAWYFVLAPESADNYATVELSHEIAAEENAEIDNLGTVESDVVILKNSTLKDVTLAEGKKMTVRPGVALSLTGDVANNGTLILQSDATNGTATLTGNVNGNAVVEQYIGSSRSWYMGIPFAEFAFAEGNVKGYDIFTESTRTWDYTLESPTSADAGYGVMINPNSGVDKLTVSGELISGDVVLENMTSDKRRFHFVGNPYPSFMKWSELGKENLEETIWFRTILDDSFAFATLSGLVSSPEGVVDNNLPPMQGFWVRVEKDKKGKLTFPTAARKHYESGLKQLRAPREEEMSIVRLTVTDGTLKDETVIYFDEKNSNGKDRLDAAKMMSNNRAEIYTLLDGEAIVINAMETIPYNQELPLGFRTNKAGEFTISANQFKGFDEGVILILTDHNNGVITNLTNFEYSFSTEIGDTNDRFSLKFVPAVSTGAGAIGTNDISLAINSAGKIVVTLSQNPENAKATVYTVSGQQVAQQSLQAVQTTLTSTLGKGVYIVSVDNKGERMTKRVVIK